MTADQKRSIDLIWEYDLGFVREKLLTEEKLPEQIINEVIVEYRKFMSLLRLGYKQLGMFSNVVDEVWHTHILFTQKYAEFCDLVFDAFVHHDPATKPVQAEGNNSIETFLDAYARAFGELPKLWNKHKPTGVAMCWPTLRAAKESSPQLAK